MAGIVIRAGASQSQSSLPCVYQLLTRGFASAVPSARASWFKHVEPAPKDPILGVTESFLADKNPDKINLGVVSARIFLGSGSLINVACVLSIS